MKNEWARAPSRRLFGRNACYKQMALDCGLVLRRIGYRGVALPGVLDRAAAFAAGPAFDQASCV
ncbi:MAG TPA: hypothetical protein VGI10_15255 [Polyangiaceae bacterium]